MAKWTERAKSATLEAIERAKDINRRIEEERGNVPDSAILRNLRGVGKTLAVRSLAVPAKLLEPVLPGAAESLHRSERATQQVLAERDPETPLPDIIERGMREAAVTLPQMAVLSRFGGAKGIVGGTMAQVFEREYSAAVKRGASPRVAFKFAGQQSAIEGGVTSLFMSVAPGLEGMFLKSGLSKEVAEGGLKGLRKGVISGAKSFGAELGEEELIELASLVNSKLAGMDPNASLEDAEEVAMDTAVTTFITWGAAKGIQTAGNRAKRLRSIQEEIESTPADVDQGAFVDITYEVLQDVDEVEVDKVTKALNDAGATADQVVEAISTVVDPEISEFEINGNKIQKLAPEESRRRRQVIEETKQAGQAEEMTPEQAAVAAQILAEDEGSPAPVEAPQPTPAAPAVVTPSPTVTQPSDAIVAETQQETGKPAPIETKKPVETPTQQPPEEVYSGYTVEVEGEAGWFAPEGEPEAVEVDGEEHEVAFYNPKEKQVSYYDENGDEVLVDLVEEPEPEAAPPAKKQPALKKPADETPAARPPFKMPEPLAKASPRYGTQQLQFESDYDRAAYILSKTGRPSAQQAKFIRALEEQGHTIDDVRRHGREVVRPYIKQQGDTKAKNVLRVPRSAIVPRPMVKPEAPAPKAPPKSVVGRKPKKPAKPASEKPSVKKPKEEKEPKAEKPETPPQAEEKPDAEVRPVKVLKKSVRFAPETVLPNTVKQKKVTVRGKEFIEVPKSEVDKIPGYVGPEKPEPKKKPPQKTVLNKNAFDAESIKGNEMGKRALVIALAAARPVRFVAANEGAEPFIAQFRKTANSLGIKESDDGIPVPVEKPPQREIDSKLLGTSSQNILDTVSGKNINVPTELDRNSQVLLKDAVEKLALSQAESKSIQDVAGHIAALQDHSVIQAEDIAEAINQLTYGRTVDESVSAKVEQEAKPAKKKQAIRKGTIADKFQKAKDETDGAFLLFKMGDFYEMFYEDAELGAKSLGLTLTTRDKSSDNPIPMAGFPYHQLDAYIVKLVKGGNKVAVVEQVDDKGNPIYGETVTPAKKSEQGLSSDAESELAKLIERYETQARKDEGGAGIAVGAENINYRWAADALRHMRDRMRAGDSVEEAADSAKSKAREWIDKHNKRRPKDVNWARSETSADSYITNAVRVLSKNKKPAKSVIPKKAKKDDKVIIGKKSHLDDQGVVERALRREQEKGKPAWWDGSHLYRLGGKYELTTDEKGRQTLRKLHNLSIGGILNHYPGPNELISTNQAAIDAKAELDAKEADKKKARDEKAEADRVTAAEENQRVQSLDKDIKDHIAVVKLRGKKEKIKILLGDRETEIEAPATVYGNLAVHKGEADSKERQWKVAIVPAKGNITAFATKKEATNFVKMIHGLSDFNMKDAGELVGTPEYETMKLAAAYAKFAGMKVDEIQKLRDALVGVTTETKKPKSSKKKSGDRRAKAPMLIARAAKPSPSKPQAKANVRKGGIASKIQEDGSNRKVGRRSIAEFLNNAFGAHMIVTTSQTSRSHPALIRNSGSVIFTRSGSWDLNIHEAGHALDSILESQNPNWYSSIGPELEVFAADPVLAPNASAPTAEEGIAELVRQYVTGQETDQQLTDRMIAAVKQTSPELHATLADARQAYRLHLSRPEPERVAADRNDRPAVATAASRAEEWFWSALTHIIGKGVLNHRYRRRLWKAVTGESTAAMLDPTGVIGSIHKMMSDEKRARDQIAKGLLNERRPDNVEVVYQNKIRTSSAILQALQGNGLTLYLYGDGFNALSKEDIRKLRDAGLPLPEKFAKHGEPQRITTKSFEQITQAVGDKNWQDFETAVYDRVAYERHTKAGHEYPGMDIRSPEDLKRASDKAFEENPEWEKHFDDLQEFMAQNLLVGMLGGQYTVNEVVAIHTKWDVYAPLQKQIENAAMGGGSRSTEPDFGVRRARGTSQLEYRPLKDSIEDRVKQAVRAYTDNAMALAVRDRSRRIGSDKRIDYKTRQDIQRTMIPLNLDRTVDATVDPLMAGEIIADGINRKTLEENGISTEGMSRRQVIEELENLPEDVFTAQDIALAIPGLPTINIYGHKKPNLPRVVGLWENGQRKYYHVADPMNFAMFVETGGQDALLNHVTNVLGNLAEPWKRAYTEALKFAIRNFPRDVITASFNADTVRGSIPGYYACLATLEMITGGTYIQEAREAAKMMARSFDATTGHDHYSRWQNFTAMVAEGIKDKHHYNMTFTEWLIAAPGRGMSLGLKTVDIINYITGGRALSKFTESLTREGAYIDARRRGLDQATAHRKFDLSSGNFAQRQANRTVAGFVRAAGFLNPALQIMWQNYEAISHPSPSRRLSLNAAKASYISSLAAAAAATNILLIRSLFDDDEAEEILENMRETPEKERLGNASIMGWFRMPFDYGMAGTLMSTVWNETQDHILGQLGKPVNKDAVERAKAVIIRAANLPKADSLIPPSVKVGVEQYRNRVEYTDREIVPSYMLDRYGENPQLQYFWDTPEIYMEIGSAAGVSPLRVQHAVKGIMTSVIDSTVVYLDKVHKGRAKWADFPLTRGLITWEPRGLNSRSVQTLMDMDAAHQALKIAIEKDTRLSKEQKDKLRSKRDALEMASETMKSITKLWDDIREERNSETPDYDRIESLEREIRDIASEFINDEKISPDILAKTFDAQIDRMMPYKPSGSRLYKPGKGAPTKPEEPSKSRAVAPDAWNQYDRDIEEYQNRLEIFRESKQAARGAIRDLLGRPKGLSAETLQAMQKRLRTAMSSQSRPKPPSATFKSRKGTKSRSEQYKAWKESWDSYRTAREEFIDFQQEAADILERVESLIDVQDLKQASP